MGGPASRSRRCPGPLPRTAQPAPHRDKEEVAAAGCGGRFRDMTARVGISPSPAPLTVQWLPKPRLVFLPAGCGVAALASPAPCVVGWPGRPRGGSRRARPSQNARSASRQPPVGRLLLDHLCSARPYHQRRQGRHPTAQSARTATRPGRRTSEGGSRFRLTRYNPRRPGPGRAASIPIRQDAEVHLGGRRRPSRRTAHRPRGRAAAPGSGDQKPTPACGAATSTERPDQKRRDEASPDVLGRRADQGHPEVAEASRYGRDDNEQPDGQEGGQPGGREGVRRGLSISNTRAVGCWGELPGSGA